MNEARLLIEKARQLSRVKDGGERKQVLLAVFHMLSLRSCMAIAVNSAKSYLPWFFSYHPGETWIQERIQQIENALNAEMHGDHWIETMPEYELRYRLADNSFQSAVVDLWRMVYMYLHGREDLCRELALHVVFAVNMAKLFKKWEVEHPELREYLLGPYSNEDKMFIRYKYFARDPQVEQDSMELWRQTIDEIEKYTQEL